MRIEVISGSPRINSVTHRLAVYLQVFLTDKTEHSIGLIDMREHAWPMIQSVYSNAEKAPEEHRELAERMFAADAFVVVTPEYNGSYSPAMKNLFDHFPKQFHKTFGIVTASVGALGGMRSRRFVATMRQLVASQRMRSPGESVSNDSSGASSPALNIPSPQRTPAAS